MRADMKSRFRAGAKVCSGAIMVLLVIAALGPAKWAPRTELGWQFDHFIGYFGITLFFCFAWPRAETEANARDPANWSLFAESRKISVRVGLRGGAGRRSPTQQFQ
jgi:hypothetical protein